MRSRRYVSAVLAALPLVLLLSSTAVAAEPPTLLVGSFEQISFEPSNERVVGRVFMFDFTEVDTLTGGLSGTSDLEGSCIVPPTGIASCRALETFTGTVDGREGTAQFANVFVVDFSTGAFTGRFTSLGGTGDLANLRGEGTFQGVGATGTYALQVTFGP